MDTKASALTEWLTIREAAQALGLTPSGVGYRLRRGYMHAVPLSPRHRLIARAEVERWAAMGRLPAGPRFGPAARRRQREQQELQLTPRGEATLPAGV